ncbi:hypothetical protein M422DRAFT_27552 [Sphaerobolus stellatus SS14]|nr:hypothetical protein M422DRAFT_27552 [Sphaerobolus stellatus SS14]
MDTTSRQSVSSTVDPEPTKEKTSNETTEGHGDEVDDVKKMEAGFAGENGGSKEENESAVAQSDVVIVTWDGPDDPGNPKNWSKGKKWAATFVVSSYTFISPISSSMMAPAVPEISRQFGVTNTVVQSMLVSIFILSYAFGPLFLGPLSEIFGRARVLQLANLFFLAFNIACGGAQNTGEFLAFRLLAGIGGSAPLSIGGGVLGDLFAPEERGQAVAIYSLAPILGPVLGPLTGSWVAQLASWRWIFWSTSIVCGTVQIFGLFYLRETFAPVLLEQRARKIRIEMGLAPNDKSRVRTQYDTDRNWKKIFGKALTRPFVMFYYEPIIQLLGIYMAFIYGLIYLVLVTLPDIYGGIYGEAPGIAGLHYLALGIGLTGASQINARLLDRIYRHLKEKNGGEGRPEYRLPSIFVGAFLLPVGLLIYGWTAQNHVFWIVPDLGIMILGAGMILIFQSVQTYVIDAFTLYAASALASVAFLRSLAGFGFPLFAPAMYKALGYGKGDTVLAACAIVLGWPAPFIFWKYGEQIRARSKHAAASAATKK